jgi:hypothetical protein
MWGKCAYSFPGKFLGSGNRCGHDPHRLAAERLALPETKSGFRIKLLTQLIEKVQAYFANPASLPLLAYREGKTNQDGSPRQNRSEAREGHALVMTTIIADLDLKSLRVGNYAPNGEFRPTPFDELARRCGMTKPSKDPAQPKPVASSRFWRHVSQLKRAGAFTVHEQYEETPDGKRGRPAIKVVSEKFLQVLGGITKAAMARARKKSSDDIAEYIGGAVAAGILPKAEHDKLSSEVRSKRVKDQLFPKPAVKNLGKAVAAANLAPSDDLLLDSWKAHAEQVNARIAEALGRRPSLVEGRALFADYGGISEPEWSARRRRI